VVTATGESFTFGLNSAGQLGTGSVKKVKGGEDMSLVPQKVGAWVGWRLCSGGGGGTGAGTVGSSAAM
jgi:hypothetical protein